MASPLTKTGFESDAGIIYPTQMTTYDNQTTPDPPYKNEQTGNIGQLGTNLLDAFNSDPSLTTKTWTFPNGNYIKIDKRDIGGGTMGYDIVFYPGSTQYGLNATYLTGLYVVMDPYSEDLDEVEHWNQLIKYGPDSPNPGYYYNFGPNQTIDYKTLFEGTQVEEDDETVPEGGMGNLDVRSNDIPFPALPTLNFLDTNMIRLYSLDSQDIRDLASYLWSSNFAQDIFKIQNDPMEAIIGLSILPITPTSTPNTDIIIGNTNSHVTSNLVTEQYYYIDFGKLYVGENLGTYYDWSPYTRADIFLPYIGNKALDVDEIIGSELWLQYMVDVLSGNCTAMLHIKRLDRKNQNENMNGIMYHWNSNMLTAGPLSAKDYTEQLKTHIGTIATLGIGAASVFATGGASTPVLVGAAAGATGAAVKESSTPTPVQHSGNIAGNHGMLGVQFPYVTLSRPNVTAASTTRHDEGLKSAISGTIGSLRGFIKMLSVHIEGVSCTDAEKDEIEKVLKEGILY